MKNLTSSCVYSVSEVEQAVLRCRRGALAWRGGAQSVAFRPEQRPRRQAEAHVQGQNPQGMYQHYYSLLALSHVSLCFRAR